MTINQFVTYLRATSEGLRKVVAENVDEASKAFELLANQLESEADKRQIDKDTELRWLYHGWYIDLIDTDTKIRQLDVAIHQIQAMYSKGYEEIRYQIDEGFSNFTYKTDDIYADFRQGMLFVKTPLVFSNANGTGGKYRLVNGPWAHSNAYKEGLILVLDRLIKQSSEMESFCRKAERKIICITHAYNQYRYVMDTDNHDMKSIIDAVTHRFVTQDKGVYTSIYETTTTQRSIPMGTYVIVIKDDGDTAINQNHILELVTEWCSERPEMNTRKSVQELRAEQKER